MRRFETMKGPKGDAAWILIDWGEVEISDSCAQAMLKIQILTNAAQKLLGGKIERRKTLPNQGREANLGIPNRERYGRLLISAEIYTCAKRACITLGAMRISRVGQMQIRWSEQKRLMVVLGREIGQGEFDPIPRPSRTNYRPIR